MSAGYCSCHLPLDAKCSRFLRSGFVSAVDIRETLGDERLVRLHPSKLASTNILVEIPKLGTRSRYSSKPKCRARTVNDVTSA